MANVSSENSEGWVSGHLYHYENLERVVRGFVHPLVVELSIESNITGFFFIRYGVGGPHVRLRLRPAEKVRDLVLDRMEQSAHAFLIREPSAHSLDEERIRRGNEAALKKDPHEVDASVYPDNSYHLLPFRPEVERYGGPSLIGFSLDYFSLSSVAVLDHLARLGQVSRPIHLTRAYELLLRQALGFATNESELSELLRYGVDWFGADLPKVVEKGTAVAQSKMQLFLQLFLDSVAETRSLLGKDSSFDSSPLNFFVVGARRLSVTLECVDRSTRLRIGASQIHMTASRLGLNNAEEVYLSQILSLSFEEAQSSTAVDDFFVPREAKSAEPVRELLPRALAALVDRSGKK